MGKNIVYIGLGALCGFRHQLGFLEHKGRLLYKGSKLQ